MKRKYLHVEILDGTLHIYSDDKRCRGDKLTTLEELDYECAVGESNENICITIPVNYDSSLSCSSEAERSLDKGRVGISKFPMTTEELRKEIVKRVDCTGMTKPFEVNVRNRKGKIYVNTVNIDKPQVDGILKQLSGDVGDWKNRKYWLTSGSWPEKDFTFRILV